MHRILRTWAYPLLSLLASIVGFHLFGATVASLGGCAKRCTRADSHATVTRRPSKPWTDAPAPRQLPGPREPSGAVSLPALGGVLVVDDEPSDSPSDGIHFLQVSDEGLVSLPVQLAPGQRSEWDDWEGATSDGKRIYLLGSHAHRDADRAQICHFPLASTRATPTRLEIKAPIRCVGGASQRRSIERTLTRAARERGFTLPDDWRHRRPKKGGLNIEGIHFHRPGRVFYLGLRSPLATVGRKQHAILLALRDLHGLAQISFAGLIDLRDRGVRALSAGPYDTILVSAGPVGKGGRFDLYLIDSLPPAPFRLAEPPRLTPRDLHRHHPWFKPEALVLYQQQLFIFSDSGNWAHEPAHYLRLPWMSQ